MEYKRNHFFNGLFIGAALGSAAVFLMGTKKGREIFKIIKEEGMDRFEKIEEMVRDYQGVLCGDVENAAEDVVNKEEKVKAPIRRKLFKGVTKRK